MPLSWNEIKSRALAFTNEWKDEVSEDAEAKSFWDELFPLHVSRPFLSALLQIVLLSIGFNSI